MDATIFFACLGDGFVSVILACQCLNVAAGGFGGSGCVVIVDQWPADATLFAGPARASDND